MDGEPEVIIQKSFFQTTKGKAILVLGILLVAGGALGITVLFRSRPSSETSAVQITPSANYGLSFKELTLSCPVESLYCSSQQLVKIKGESATTYQVASQSAVLNLVNVPKENIALGRDKQTGKKRFFTSTPSVKQDKCYIIFYTLPQDATIGDILSLPIFEQNKPIAIVNPNSEIAIQVRSSSFDPQRKCSLERKSPDFFKNF